MIISSAIGTAGGGWGQEVSPVLMSSRQRCLPAHGDDPSRLRHLVVDLPEGRRHLVCEGAGNNHHVCLSLWARRERLVASQDTHTHTQSRDSLALL